MDNNINENKENGEVKEEKTEVKEEIKNIREFTTYDAVFAWFSYVASYLFCLVFPVSVTPFGGMLFVIMLFLFASVFIRVKGHKLPATSALAGLSAVVLSSSLVLSSNSFIHFFAYVYCLGAFCYFVYTAMGNASRKGFSNYLIADWAEAIFVQPFISLKKPQMVHAMFSGKRKGSLNVIKKLAIGLGITVVPTTLAFTLLSYDERFTNLMGNLFRLEQIDIFTQVCSLLCAAPLGMLMFSLYISSSDRKSSGFFSEEKIEKVNEKVKTAHLITIVAATVPLLAIYVLFFVSQWQYYVSAFTNVLPEKFSYAEYAREGFFQLCTVSVINLAVIAAVILFTKKSRASSVVLKILTVIFSVFTLVLIATAIAKLIMYIGIYGLTQKRFYAAWFMLVLALIFIAVAVSRFVPKIHVLTVSAAILVVSFACLSLCNADSLIARYNVDRYINGDTSTVDVLAISGTGDAAIPELIRLAQHIDSESGSDIIGTVRLGYYSFDEDVQGELINILLDKKEGMEIDKDGFFTFTLNSYRAEKAMKEAGISE